MPKTGLSPDEIREKAIAATVARMRRQGFAKVSLVEVAEDLGISHAALYSYFAGKEALLDAVAARWLLPIEAELEKIARQERDPLAKLRAWFLKLHEMKREKVQNDPELYKSFDLAAQTKKPFVRAHLESLHCQVAAMAKEAMAARKLRKDSAEKVAEILLEAMVGFSHPKLVVQYLGVDREPLLKQTLDVVLKGMA